MTAAAMARGRARAALARGIGANLLGQAAVAFAQLAAVPAFALHWGPARYGGWLMLWTLPGWLTMADLGLATAAGNGMAVALAAGRPASAAALFRTARAGVWLVGGVALALAAGVALVGPGWLRTLAAATAGRPGTVLLLLAVYGAIGLDNGVLAAGWRAIGGYAWATGLLALATLGEAAAAVALLVGDGAPVLVAAGYLAVRLAANRVLAIGLARRAAWPAGQGADARAARRALWRPGLAAAAIPCAQALAIQGPLLILGAVAGSAAVPAFAATRTLARVGLQGVLVVNHAVMPAMTLAAAAGEREVVARQARLSHRIAWAGAIGGGLGLWVLGGPAVRLWTAGALVPGRGLLAGIALATAFTALWQPAANLLLALNRQERFSWRQLGLAVGVLMAAVPLARLAGASGVALALAAGDAAMLWWTARVVRSEGLPPLVRLARHRSG